MWITIRGLPTDFGQVDVRYQDGTEERVHFFASRLKYSRWVELSLVTDEKVKTLVRALVDHSRRFQRRTLGGRLWIGRRRSRCGGAATASSRSGIRHLRAWRSIFENDQDPRIVKP